MDAGTEALLTAGSDALRAGEWAVARQRFEGVLEQTTSPEAWLGLGNAVWWLGETEASVRCLERAYAGFRRRPDAAQATFAAVELCLTYVASLGNHAAAQGWLARAARLVADGDLGPLDGWVRLCRAMLAEEAGEPHVAERWAREAGEVASATGDGDLELCAMSVLGAALVAMGRLQEGVALLDEAMAGSLGGEVETLDTVVLTSCQTIISCSRAGDLQRARQWVRAAEGFNHRYGSPHLFAVCRTHYASVLLATGDWAAAEAELGAALTIGSAAEPAVRALALAKLAELRLTQGRLEEAERLIEGYADRSASVYVAAAIHRARGRAALAASVLERRLGELGEDCIEAAPLLELLVEVEIERDGAGEDLVSRAAGLKAAGRRTGCAVFVARAERMLGRLRLADSSGAAAVPHLERALAGFRDLELPPELGRTRLLLARAHAETARELAIGEAREALAAFEDLGAAHDADAAAAFLRSLGVKAARRGPKGLDVLTKREQEVLALLGEGLSNPEIAERLVVSRKTVEHHVAHVLAKLDLRGRAEAAAYAVRSQK